MKKWLIRLIVFAVISLGLFLLYIEWNKDELVAVAIEEANQQINGTISYSSSDISFLRSFPDLRISLNDLKVESGSNENKSKLFETAKGSVDFALRSLINRSAPLLINRINIDEGILYPG